MNKRTYESFKAYRKQSPSFILIVLHIHWVCKEKAKGTKCLIPLCCMVCCPLFEEYGAAERRKIGYSMSCQNNPQSDMASGDFLTCMVSGGGIDGVWAW